MPQIHWRRFGWSYYVAAGLLSIFLGCQTQAPDSLLTDRPPNIIIIFTDDQGYADIGRFGAEGFETPHLDRMAAEGATFTSFYVASSGCSPSRAALLTGSYPQRVSMPRVLSPQENVGLHPDEITIADLLKPLGYATAAVGKWHLGDHPEHLPLAQGFDEYFGLPYSNDMTPDPTKNPNPPARRWPPLPLLDQSEVVEIEPDQSQLTRRYTERAVDFIERNADRPFFLYLPHSMPHLPLFVSERFAGASIRGLYGDVMMELDWSVGEVLETLERLEIDQQTLVVFTSDNGPWLIKGSHSGSAGRLREGKGTTFEGGQRVPAIMRWPGHIPPSLVVEELVTAMDLFPTVAALVGAELPRDRILDGKDIWPLMAGRSGAVTPHDAFFYYWPDQLHAVRSGRWKLHVPHSYRTVDGGKLATRTFQGIYGQGKIGLSLFDLENDVGETTNLAHENPEVVTRLLALIEQARDDLGDALTGREGRNIRPPGRVTSPS